MGLLPPEKRPHVRPEKGTPWGSRKTQFPTPRIGSATRDNPPYSEAKYFFIRSSPRAISADDVA